ncbi:Opioid growth factor receptor [Cyphellophora attinorum]|uniref:Opioid growth factor receptor n=1 Tax=Cyphellophora attinorum TaxID=1664694 RepID=A0A0N1HAP0_9EURO|nr:Opioid growth factor receptor [Phialophora attinorum]KPI39833.1 Opioid growth factor receptor [Phialophora attinorum]
MSTLTVPLLIRFFDPTLASPDTRNRTLITILSWPDSHLEASHDYIQTVFPLPEESMFSFAPIVTSEVRAAFLARSELRASLRRALERMLAFYGLQFSDDAGGEDALQASNNDGDAIAKETETVTRGPTFDTASRNWVMRFNHNHLRLTRILRSLRVLGLESEAAALYDFLRTDEAVTGTVSPRSQMYWRRAAQRGLWLRLRRRMRVPRGLRG